MRPRRGSLEPHDWDPHRFAFLLKPGHPEYKSVSKLTLGNRESESKKSLFAKRQFVPLLIRLQLFWNNRPIATGEHKRLIDLRGRVASPGYDESNERRREMPVTVVRL